MKTKDGFTNTVPFRLLIKRAARARSRSPLSGKIFLICLIAALPWAVDARGTNPLLERAFLDGQISSHRTTGLLNFIGTQPNSAVQPKRKPLGNAPEDYGRQFVEEYGAAFGIQEAASELRLKKSTRHKSGGNNLRYQQFYRELPVFAGEIILNLDNKNALHSMNGEVAPMLSLPVTPNLTAVDARDLALQAVSKWYGTEMSDLRSSIPALEVYDANLLNSASILKTSLVWNLEVTHLDMVSIRELVLIDAHTGVINLHFNQVHQARNRATHSAGGTGEQPGVLVCSEGDSSPACAGGDLDVINAHEFAGDAYDFYADVHARDGIDDKGGVITSTVHWTGSCPNAFWTGSQMVYCTAWADADDVVGHELTHGVTQHESNLLYYYESGAINESLSDVWGEFIDLTNGVGNDSPSVRWLIGEDLAATGGAIRDMRFPGSFGDPDRMTSRNYHVSGTDFGGVHYNSGVNNKAAYLMVDGDTFNGVTVNGIGISKTAKIYYEAQTNLLTSAADYSDLYVALYQACLNLVGTSGISSTDCATVRAATDAVEMNMDPRGNPGFSPEADMCPSGVEQGTLLFSDGLEAGSDNWSVSTDPWYHYTDYASEGTHSIGSPNVAEYGDARAWNTVPVRLANNSYLHFDHAFGFEAQNGQNYDGGIVEYSTDGVNWQDLGSLLDAGQGYGGFIYSGYGNPLAGHSAFVRESHGYVSSRFNLGTLAGENFQVRFRLGTDGSVAGPLGWVVDNVKIYQCGASAAPEPTSCSGTDVLVQNQEFGGAMICEATSSLETNAAVLVKSGAVVEFQSPETTLGAGFYVELGAEFTVKVSP